MDTHAARHELVYRDLTPTHGRAAWPFHLLIAANVLALLAGAIVRGDSTASLGVLLAAVVANSGSALLIIRGRRALGFRDEQVQIVSRELDRRCHLDRIPGHLRRLSLGGATMAVAPQNAPPVGARARLMFALDGFEFILPVQINDSERRSGTTTLDLAFDPADIELVTGLLPVLGAPRRQAANRRRPPFDRAA